MHILGEGILTERLQVPHKYPSACADGKPGHLPGGRNLQCHPFAETGPKVWHRFIQPPSMQASENDKS